MKGIKLIHSTLSPHVREGQQKGGAAEGRGCRREVLVLQKEGDAEVKKDRREGPKKGVVRGRDCRREGLQKGGTGATERRDCRREGL